MDTPVKGDPAADLRDYLAEERTFLAWIRTGIALMAFGFLVAHFGIFGDEPSMTQHASEVQIHQLSLWFGTAVLPKIISGRIGGAVQPGSEWRR